MDLQEYQKHAKRTVNYKLPTNIQLASMALGISGELGELIDIIQFPFETKLDQATSIMDEGGDVCWYIVNTATILSLDWTQLLPQDINKDEQPEYYLLAALRFGANIADAIKKAIAQGHELAIEVITINLKGLIATLIELFNYYGVTLEDTCTYNHMKLMKRYKNGFSTEASVNREV